METLAKGTFWGQLYFSVDIFRVGEDVNDRIRAGAGSCVRSSRRLGGRAFALSGAGAEFILHCNGCFSFERKCTWCRVSAFFVRAITDVNQRFNGLRNRWTGCHARRGFRTRNGKGSRHVGGFFRVDRDCG